MQLLTIVIFTICFSARELEYFRDKKIYIIYAAYPTYKIVYDVAEINDPPIIVWSDNYKNTKQIHDDVSYITKHGDNYKIKVGPKYLCNKGKNVVMCKENSITVWQITKLVFGYTIAVDNLCITASDTKLFLEKCKENKDQLFEFIIRPAYLDCLDMINFTSNTNVKEKSIVNEIKKKLKNEDLDLLKNKIADKLQIDNVEALGKHPNKENFNKYLDKSIPEIEKKNNVKEILDKIWENDFGIPWWQKAWNAFKNFFCP